MIRLFIYLIKRLLSDFDVPDGELEFWEWVNRENTNESRPIF